VISTSPVLTAAAACGAAIGARGPGCAGGAISAVGSPPVPSLIALEQNAPNPFNPSTRIAFSVPRSGRATLRIYDIAGRAVATLVDRDLPAGRHVVTWDGTDGGRRTMASGVYFYRLQVGGAIRTRSMILLK
jgi:hypothetical protein